MKQPNHARLRLRLPRLETKPKRVRLEGWRDYAAIGKNPALRAELDDIVESIGRDRDALLEDMGIMHLHLGGRHSDTLIFLIQYDDLVLLLESNSHVHFRTNPKGKNIAALVQSWFVNLERDLADAAHAAQLAIAEAERQAAEERRDRLAAALAKLMREAGQT